MLNARIIAKLLAKAIVYTVAKSFVTRTLESTIPVTEKYHAADVTGMVAGGLAEQKLEPHTNKMVDDLFDRYETSKKA
jgi:hypothetical protein